MGHQENVSENIGGNAFLSEFMLMLPLAIRGVWLSPNEMKREQAQIGYENFDAPKCPVHDGFLLVP